MTEYQLLSVNVGKVQNHDGWKTAFYKAPVTGKVWVSELYVEGDEQQFKKYHGGKFRPILAYSAKHYPLWQEELGFEFPYGGFAENFTISGDLDENTVCLGDVYAVGDTLRIQVSQPRLPCDNISRRWEMPDLTNLVKQTGRTGWYMSVIEEGYAEAGMPITLLERPHPEWTIEAVRDAYQKRARRKDQAHELSQIEALEIGWRERLRKAAEKS